ncbi:MAG: uridine kinase [Clostridiales bacterium]|jgi:uridine kinase|nr:uridine kinase [Clostridiales bacterium]MDN5282710.1 uridine kinase [Candidatus Ozemobacter sp.]
MYIIGICGLSGSGKSSVSRAVLERFPGKIGVLEHDMYYYAKKDKPKILNYDHPDALETGLLIKHINDLRSGKTIQRPIYDFKTSDRLKETVEVAPHPILIVEGLLLFNIPELMPLLDLRIYVDVPLDRAIIRRIKRDHIERGRTVKSIITQYENTVRDAAINMVQPSRYLADLIIPQGASNRAGLEVLYGKIRDLLSKSDKPDGFLSGVEK